MATTKPARPQTLADLANTPCMMLTSPQTTRVDVADSLHKPARPQTLADLANTPCMMLTKGSDAR